MGRRDFLAAGASMALAFGDRAAAGEIAGAIDERRIRDYLRSIMPTQERIEQFTRKFSPEESIRLSNGWTYDAELGWVHTDAVHKNGVDGSKTFYHYEADGARRAINAAGSPCRVHAYGNSFTHCDQVSDNETWEEYLAAHLQEPIRNYGVGGYGVYQAYRRLVRVESRTPVPSVILNIWDDDHFRSLDAWRSIRFGRGSQCGFTLPHVRVDVKNDRCEHIENPLKEPEQVAKLRDEEFLYQTFKDDPVLHLALAARSGGPAAPEAIDPVAVSFGIPEARGADTDLAQAIRRIHTEAALFATRHILTWTEAFAARAGKKLFLILSFGRGNIERELRGEPRFDQRLLEWLSGKPYPVVDMRDHFAREYRSFAGGIDAFLDRHYHGHHTPAGNFFTAWAIKERVARSLDPAPLPYR